MVKFSQALLFLGAGVGTIVFNGAQQAEAAQTRTVYSTRTEMITTTVPAGGAAAAPTPRDSDSGGGSEEFTGDGTFYSPSVGTGSCGTDHSDSEKVAALNAPQFGNPANPNASPFCGRKVRVTGPKGTTEATIVDKCPVCKSGDLDLSPGAFDEIGDEDAGRIPITWSFIDG